MHFQTTLFAKRVFKRKKIILAGVSYSPFVFTIYWSSGGVKTLLFFIKLYVVRANKGRWGVDKYLHAFFTSPLDGIE